MLIEKLLPDRDVSLVRTDIVEADPSTVYEAILAAEIAEDPLMKAATWLRSLPEKADALLHGEPAPSLEPAQRTLQDLVDASPCRILGRSEDEEVVIGVVGHLWNPAEPELSAVGPERFADFDEPNQIKGALSISVRPYDAERTLVTIELRAHATDEEARERFLRTWPMFRPAAVGAIRVLMRNLARTAEGQAPIPPSKQGRGSQDRDVRLEEIEKSRAGAAEG